MMRLALQNYKRLARPRYLRQFSNESDPGAYIEPRGTEFPVDFRLIPTFLNRQEQRALLLSALRKLGDVGSRETRRKRKGKQSINFESQSLSDVFHPDEYYNFEKGHYDGVIMHFRETVVTSWPDQQLLEPILLRLRGLLPATLQECIQTHILHLASNGHILPHVDNVGACGSWIAAVSLGGERVLRMDCEADKDKSFDILLPSGSAYVQRDTVRYSYKHSILPGGTYFKGRLVPPSQRISVMLRDRLQTNTIK